jgi:uncharacterized protein (DUF488 family)
MPNPCYTVGHSTLAFDDFVSLLGAGNVTHIIDVRRFPRSRRYPHFNIEVLPVSLGERGIGYTHMPVLGGRRASSNAPATACSNDYWQNRSFRNYADHALTAEFATALEELRELMRSDRCAIMCAEAVWWRCHRRVITDYLLAGGDQVFHLTPPHGCAPAQITPAARLIEGGGLCYIAEG